MPEKGFTVMRSEPFAYILSYSLRNERCHYCLTFMSSKNGKGNRCAQCHYAIYCNKSCQKGAWSYHKKECKALKKVYPRIPPDTARIMALIIWKMLGSGANEFEIVGHKKRSFADLFSHSEDIKRDRDRMEHFYTVYNVVKEYVGESFMPSAEESLVIFGKIAVNCYTISDSDMQPIGAGVYLGASALDHSCMPNAQVIFDKFHLTVNITEDMEDVDLSKVFISYIDVLDPLEERRKNLMSQYYFHCTCALCIDKKKNKLMESVRCLNTSCNETVDSSLGSCSSCGRESLDTKVAHRLHNRIRAELPRFNSLMKVGNHQTVYYECKALLKETLGKLHPMNARLVKLLDNMVESCIMLEHWPEAVGYILLTLPAYRRYYGPDHPLLGLQLAKLGKLHNFLGNSVEAEKYLVESSAIIKVIYGENHDTYLTVKEVLMQCQEGN